MAMRFIKTFAMYESEVSQRTSTPVSKDYLLVHLNGKVYFKVEEILEKIRSREAFKYPEMSQGRMTMMDSKHYQHSFLYHGLGELISHAKDENGWYLAEWERTMSTGETYHGRLDTIFYDEFLFLIAEDLIKFDDFECLTLDDIWGTVLSDKSKSEHPEVQELLGSKSLDELKKTYRRLVMQHHPDRVGENEIIKYITVAYLKIKKSDERMRNILKYSIFEKRMSRTMSHIEDDEFVVMTSWRGAMPTRVNMQRIKDLEADLANRHLGFIDMRGVGQEDEGPSVEKSMMIINHDGREDFLESMLALAVKYEQDFILYGKDGVSKLMDQEGNVVQTFTGVEKGEAAYYSALDKDRKFHLVEGQQSVEDFQKSLGYHFLKSEYKRDKKGKGTYPNAYNMPKDLKDKVFFVTTDVGYEYEVTFTDNDGGFRYRMIHPFYQKPFDDKH